MKDDSITKELIEKERNNIIERRKLARVNEKLYQKFLNNEDFEKGHCNCCGDVLNQDNVSVRESSYTGLKRLRSTCKSCRRFIAFFKIVNANHIAKIALLDKSSYLYKFIKKLHIRKSYEKYTLGNLKLVTLRDDNFALNYNNPFYRGCSLCNEVKPIQEFSKQLRGSFRTQARCKECLSKLSVEYTRKSAEELTDTYIKGSIRQMVPGLQQEDITNEMIEERRLYLKINRLLKERGGGVYPSHYKLKLKSKR